MATLSDILSRNVRTIRAAKRLSQEDLAAIAGIDRTYISGVERGVRNPTVAVLERIANGLGVAAYELLKP